MHTPELVPASLIRSASLYPVFTCPEHDMKFSVTFVAVALAHTAAGAAVSTNGGPSTQEIVETILANPHFLPANSKTATPGHFDLFAHHPNRLSHATGVDRRPPKETGAERNRLWKFPEGPHYSDQLLGPKVHSPRGSR
jgi:hypothetical protein